MWLRSISRRLNALQKYPRTKPPYRSFSTPREDRISRITNWFPQRLRPFASRILSAPGSNLTSFLVLHEVTAIAPLFGLGYFFYHWDYLPPIHNSGYMHAVFEKALPSICNSLKKWGYSDNEFPKLENPEMEPSERKMYSEKIRLAVACASAWAIVKVLAPVRIAVSLWATPWFARSIITPFWLRMRWLVGR